MGQDWRPWICHLKLDAQDPGHVVFTACSTTFQADMTIIYWYKRKILASSPYI